MLSPLCPACSTPVFANEAHMAADRTPFHKACVKCGHCKKTLTPADINEHEKQLFCRVCYENVFRPRATIKCPEKKKMQVLPVQGVFKVKPKPVVEEGPTPEEIKQKEMAEAAAKAWEEATAIGANVIKTSAVRIEEVLSMGL
eukprot:GFUD01071077.1.p1 GENE.GFUD01071077.1~~GFUD01071077.1.p1  ORF type:complete len:152 (+),score=52.64 GFUD01071077.1:28-456(+)